MSTEQNLTCVTKTAGADLSTTGQYRFVKLDANGAVVLAGDGEQPYGILQNKPALGADAQVAISGWSRLEINEAVTADDLIGCGANGTGNIADTGDPIVAFVVDAGSADDITTVDFRTFLGVQA